MGMICCYVLGFAVEPHIVTRLKPLEHGDHTIVSSLF